MDCPEITQSHVAQKLLQVFFIQVLLVVLVRRRPQFLQDVRKKNHFDEIRDAHCGFGLLCAGIDWGENFLGQQENAALVRIFRRDGCKPLEGFFTDSDAVLEDNVVVAERPTAVVFQDSSALHAGDSTRRRKDFATASVSKLHHRNESSRIPSQRETS